MVVHVVTITRHGKNTLTFYRAALIAIAARLISSSICRSQLAEKYRPSRTKSKSHELHLTRLIANQYKAPWWQRPTVARSRDGGPGALGGMHTPAESPPRGSLFAFQPMAWIRLTSSGF